MNLEYWFDFMEGWSTTEILLTVGVLVGAALVVLVLGPYSSDHMRSKRNAIIEDEYRKRFKK